MLHCHRFTEIERVYTGRLKKATGDLTFDSDATLERILYGVTTIISRCCVCQKLDKLEVLGDARPHAPVDPSVPR